MSQWNNPSYPSSASPAWGTVASATNAERGAFIRRTYMHLAGAIGAFAVIEAVLFNTPAIRDPLLKLMFAGRWSWLIVMLAFMGVAYVANAWARSATSKGMQYLGLGLYVVVEAIIFLPLLLVAARLGGGMQIIYTAGLLTAVVVAALSVVAFATGADFSFLRGILILGGFAALGVIVAALVFGFTLGVFFTGCMIALASGYILYDTSNIIHHYRTDQHVSAALALFASVALLFWYILRLLMQLQKR